MSKSAHITSYGIDKWLDVDKININVLVISLATIWIVHILTRSREREKHIFELCRAIEAAARELADSAFIAWNEDAGAERAKAVARVKSQLQLIGALANRLELLSEGWRFRWRLEGPATVDATIRVGPGLVKLRRAITEDPFEDPKRNPDLSRATSVISEIGIFILGLDLSLRNWIRPL